VHTQIREEHEKMNRNIFCEIQDKLASDAFIEGQEKEIERQAEEFAKYRREADAIRKAKERQVRSLDCSVSLSLSSIDIHSEFLIWN
jgi:hypothetical protein